MGHQSHPLLYTQLYNKGCLHPLLYTQLYNKGMSPSTLTYTVIYQRDVSIHSYTHSYISKGCLHPLLHTQLYTQLYNKRMSPSTLTYSYIHNYITKGCLYPLLHTQLYTQLYNKGMSPCDNDAYIRSYLFMCINSLPNTAVELLPLAAFIRNSGMTSSYPARQLAW